MVVSFGLVRDACFQTHVRLLLGQRLWRRRVYAKICVLNA